MISDNEMIEKGSHYWTIPEHTHAMVPIGLGRSMNPIQVNQLCSNSSFIDWFSTLDSPGQMCVRSYLMKYGG